MTRLLRQGPLREGECLEFGQDEQAGFLVCHGDQVFAYRNRCPHLGVALNWQPHRFLDLDGLFIQCALHGALFQIDNGFCIAGPCQGRSLEALPIRIIGDDIWLLDDHAADTA
ncbi:MAG: Rieske 2Fe-2S domain-containing protein [Gammaproteobacteria bacterium]|nr:Rieske 2Fe-2S domain-containing protein [Gammaproteobacteria bacterium]